MTTAFIDTTVLIHIFRKDNAAMHWFTSQTTIFSITPIVWMEYMVGVPNKRAQADSLKLLTGFEVAHLTLEDMNWAMQQIVLHRFSQGVAIMDCINASICYRLAVPIYTHNVKDYVKVLPSQLVIKPY